MGRPWETDFFPEWLWILMTNLAMLGAVIAFVTMLMWVWDRGPRLLIKYGPGWMTRLGLRWGNKRTMKERL